MSLSISPVYWLSDFLRHPNIPPASIRMALRYRMLSCSTRPASSPLRLSLAGRMRRCTCTITESNLLFWLFVLHDYFPHSPRNSTSNSKSTPNCSCTRLRASTINATTSAALAPPKLTKKLAWRFEICALPWVLPFNPGLVHQTPCVITWWIFKD